MNNGELIHAIEDRQYRDSKLVEISAEDIKDHLVMVYFEDFKKNKSKH